MKASGSAVFIDFFTIVIYAAILVGAGLHIALDKHQDARTPRRIVELFLLYFFVIGVGFQGVYAFVGHTLFANETAKQIGWPAGNPFQFEVAIADLTIGVLGILCIWIRENFWYATGIANAVWVFGVSYGHVYQAVVNGNYSPDNLGLLFFSTLLLAIILLGLLVAYRALSQRARASVREPASL